MPVCIVNLYLNFIASGKVFLKRIKVLLIYISWHITSRDLLSSENMPFILIFCFKLMFMFVVDGHL